MVTLRMVSVSKNVCVGIEVTNSQNSLSMSHSKIKNITITLLADISKTSLTTWDMAFKHAQTWVAKYSASE